MESTKNSNTNSVNGIAKVLNEGVLIVAIPRWNMQQICSRHLHPLQLIFHQSWCNRVCILMVSGRRSGNARRNKQSLRIQTELMITNLSITHSHKTHRVIWFYNKYRFLPNAFLTTVSPQMQPFAHVCSQAVGSAFVQHNTALNGIMSQLRKWNVEVTCESQSERR